VQAIDELDDEDEENEHGQTMEELCKEKQRLLLMLVRMKDSMSKEKDNGQEGSKESNTTSGSESGSGPGNEHRKERAKPNPSGQLRDPFDFSEEDNRHEVGNGRANRKDEDKASPRDPYHAGIN